MSHIAVFLMVFVNLGMAWHHANLIQDGRPIRHGWWGLAYVLLAALMAWINGSWLLFMDLCLVRKVVFDLSLNTMRGLPLFYVSRTTTSIIDRVHYRLFGLNSKPYMAVYFMLIIILTALL